MNKKFTASKTLVAAAIAALMTTGAMAANPDPVDFDGLYDDVSIVKDQMGTLTGNTTVNGKFDVAAGGHLTSEESSSAADRFALTVNGGTNEGTIDLGLDNTAESKYGHSFVINGDYTNKGVINAGVLDINAALNTGLFVETDPAGDDYANHVKFSTLNLNENGTLHVTELGKQGLSAADDAIDAGETETDKSKVAALVFTDGTFNVNGGAIAIGTDNKLVTGEGDDAVAYSFVNEEGHLNVAITGLTDEKTVVNFNKGAYQFGSVPVSVAKNANVEINLKGSDVAIDDLTLGTSSDSGTIAANLTSGKLTAGNVVIDGTGTTVNLGTAEEGSAVVTVDQMTQNNGTVNLKNGSLVFTGAASGAATDAKSDLIVAGGEFNIDEAMTLSVPDMAVTNGSVNVAGELSADKLSVSQNEKSSVSVTGSLNAGELTIAKTDGVTATGEGANVQFGTLTVTENGATGALKVTDGATLTLADDAKYGDKTIEGAIAIDGGVLSTSTAHFLDADSEFKEDKQISFTKATVSFTDEGTVDKTVIQTLATGFGADVSSFEIHADVTDDGKVIESANVADWGTIYKGATLAKTTAKSDSLEIKQSFGAKNLDLTGQDSDSDTLSFDGDTFTLVGGEAGTQLITSSHATKPIKLEKLQVTGSSV